MARIPLCKKEQLAMANSMRMTGAQIRYLLALKKLNCESGIRSADIAREMDLSKPSVHKMMNCFLKRGYVAKGLYQLVYLTETGYQQATLCYLYYSAVVQKLALKDRKESSVERAICAFLAESSMDILEKIAKEGRTIDSTQEQVRMV